MRALTVFFLPPSAQPRRAPLQVQAARVANVEIPNKKRVETALTYIYGIGPTTAKVILETTVRHDACGQPAHLCALPPLHSDMEVMSARCAHTALRCRGLRTSARTI